MLNREEFTTIDMQFEIEETIKAALIKAIWDAMIEGLIEKLVKQNNPLATVFKAGLFNDDLICFNDGDFSALAPMYFNERVQKLGYDVPELSWDVDFST